jgi:hypothetical protein
LTWLWISQDPKQKWFKLTETKIWYRFYLEGALNIHFIHIYMRMIDHSSRRIWGPGFSRWRIWTLPNKKQGHITTCFIIFLSSCMVEAAKPPLATEIGLECAPFVVFVYFSSFEHAKNLLIMGPNNTKNSSKSVIFSYVTLSTLSEFCFYCKKHKIWSRNCFFALCQNQEWSP